MIHLRNFRFWHYSGFLAVLFLLTACVSSPPTPLPASQVRVAQTRIFSAPNQQILLSTILTTLQDLGYNIVKVNTTSNEISAQKEGSILLSVMTLPYHGDQFAVRVNAQQYQPPLFGIGVLQFTTINDPTFYQKNFFEPLSKSLFLQKKITFQTYEHTLN